MALRSNTKCPFVNVPALSVILRVGAKYGGGSTELLVVHLHEPALWIIFHANRQSNFFWVPTNFKNVAAKVVDGFFIDAICPSIRWVDPQLIWCQRHLRGEPNLLQPLHDEAVARHYASIRLRLVDPLHDLCVRERMRGHAAQIKGEEGK